VSTHARRESNRPALTSKPADRVLNLSGLLSRVARQSGFRGAGCKPAPPPSWGRFATCPPPVSTHARRESNRPALTSKPADRVFNLLGLLSRVARQSGFRGAGCKPAPPPPWGRFSTCPPPVSTHARRESNRPALTSKPADRVFNLLGLLSRVARQSGFRGAGCKPAPPPPWGRFSTCPPPVSTHARRESNRPALASKPADRVFNLLGLLSRVARQSGFRGAGCKPAPLSELASHRLGDELLGNFLRAMCVEGAGR
jgi:uncharacterized protein YihD (DUF1040 family)